MEQEIKKIQVEPTKDLFVSILTRDISFQDAIIELIDNSIDGAHRVVEHRVVDDSEPLDGFEVQIDLDSEKFSICDNCGGIPLDIAINYAFRFGRPKGAKGVDGSIGQFGVGMKRALFSFGRKYIVESTTQEDWFRLEINLDEWLESKRWEFDLTEYGDNGDNKKPGTRIEVTALTKDASERFDLEYFRTRLRNEIQRKHGSFIDQGLIIRVGDSIIPKHQWQIISDARFAPAYHKEEYGEGETMVSALIYAGVGKPSPSEAGWYIICNGRLLLEAEKTRKTGWGEELNEPDEPDETNSTPLYHNQFARFRGYVLFNCQDASQLPWNTTKTDIDPDNPIWRDVKERMTSKMRPVIDFLRKVANESALPEEKRELTTALTGAEYKVINKARKSDSFIYPEFTQPPPAPKVSIQFHKEKELVDALSRAMGTSSARSTGEAAFDEACQRHEID